MTKPKFKIGDHVMYQGNIYKIHSIETNHMNFIYNVVCVKNIIPYDSIAVSLGMAAEDDMSLVDFYPPEKEEWLNDVCKWLKDNIDLEHDYPNNADELIRDLRNYIYNKEYELEFEPSPKRVSLEKAVKWLESVNLDYYQIREGVFSTELVEDFRKAMEA